MKINAYGHGDDRGYVERKEFDYNEANVCCVFLPGNFAEARANRCVFENIKYGATLSASTL